MQLVVKILLCIFFYLSSISVFANDTDDYFKKGLIAQDSNNYSEAFEFFTIAAKNNKKSAQYKLGEMYQYGEGVIQDYNQALKWFSLSANQNYSLAQNKLGEIHEFGSVGVTVDYKKSVQWYLLAAEQGYDVAQHNLASMYASGLGVPINNKKALQWYYKSAEQGNSASQLSLGLIYSVGMLDVIEDKIAALKWYLIAFEKSELLANYAIENIKRNMTDEEIVIAQKLASECINQNYKGC